MADGTVRGRFVWHDLMTPNSAGAHEFYSKAVGWQSEAWEQDQAYLMFAGPNGPIGGTVETRATTPQWLPYISTADVDATIEAATRLGATVQTPATALPNGGRFAALIDPQGAPFGIHASSSTDPDSAPAPGEFSWHELSTSVAPGIAFGFYAALFDWDEIDQHDMGPMGMYLVFGRDGKQLGGMFDKGSAGKPGNAYWLGYVSVTDLDATIERIKAARGSLLTGPMDVPGGDRIATLMDPHGAFFALHVPAGAAQPAAGRPAAAKPAKPPKPPKPGERARPTELAEPAKPVKRAKAVARTKPSKPAAKPAPAKKATRKVSPKKRPAKKAAAKKKKPAARKPAKKKSKAKKTAPRKAAKKAKRKAKPRKRGR